MKNDLLDTWVGAIRRTGVHVELTSDGWFIRSIVMIRMAGDKLEMDRIDAKCENQKETINEIVAAKNPVALNIYGKGVLSKWQKADENNANDNLFPGLDNDTFYIQDYQNIYIKTATVVRKDTADQIMRTIVEKGLKIVQLSLGYWALDAIADQLPTGKISIDNQLLTISKSGIQGVVTNEPTESDRIKVDQYTLPGMSLPAYSAAFTALFESTDFAMVNEPVIKANKSKALLNTWTRQRVAWAASATILILLLNFFMWDYLNKEKQLAERSILSENTSAKMSTDYTETLQKKDSLLHHYMHWNGGLSYAYILSEIAGATPNGIELNKISVNEQDDKEHENKPVYPGSIRITGQTRDLGGFNDAIKNYQKLPWIKQVKLVSYTENRDNGNTEFELQAYVR